MNKLVNVRSYLTNVSPTFKRPTTVAYIGDLVNSIDKEIEIIPQDAILELMRHVNEVDVTLEKGQDLGDSFVIVTAWLTHFGGNQNQAEKPEGDGFIKSHIAELVTRYSNRRTINYIERLLRAVRDDAWVDSKGVLWLEDHLIEMNREFSENPPEVLTLSHLTTALWINGFVPKAAAT